MINFSELLQPYKPAIYDGVLEYEEVIKTEGEALYYAHEALQNILLSQKLSTMPIDTITSYESIFGIIGNPDTETLEFRRQRIINRLSLKPPFPMEFLESRLDEIIGVGRWTIDYDKDEFTLYIESSASDQQWATELSITINSIKPANIVYVNVPAIFNSIYVNSKSGYSQNTANYVSGLWIVGEKNIVSYSDKGDIVMATTLTMTDTMMELMLVQLKDEIVADFYFNDSVVKPAVKTINSATNQLVSTCDLLASDGITELTKVVLRNASGEALDVHNVSVPVLDGITLKHTLTIGEGVN